MTLTEVNNLSVGDFINKAVGVGKTLVTHPIQSFTTGAKAIENAANHKVNLGGFLNTALSNPIRTAFYAAALPATGAEMAAARIAPKIAMESKAAASAVGNFVKRNTVNPFAGTTVKQGFTNIGKRILGGAVTGTAIAGAVGLSRYAVGQETSLGAALKKYGILGAAEGLNPIGAIIGYGTGEAQNIMQASKSAASKIPSSIPSFSSPSLPQIPLIQSIPTDYTVSGFNIPQAPTIVNLPSAPAVGGGFSPSVSVGGGSSATDLLLLAMLGLGGYAGYKALHKKKKYKKHKSHKKGR